MAQNKKSVLIYCDLIHTVEVLSDEEAGKLFKHLMKYINDLNPEPPDKLTQVLFEPIKQTLKRDLVKWQERSERNRDIALEGWEKRRQANASNGIKTDAKNADRDSVSDSVSVTDSVSVSDKKYNFVEPEYLDTFITWMDYKKARKESYKTEASQIAFYKKLTKLSNNNPLLAGEIVEQSMANNWAGIFEIKTSNQQPQQNAPRPKYIPTEKDKW